MKHIISFVILLFAVVAYILGSAFGAVILFVVGGLLETIFWFRVLSRKDATNQ